MKLQIIPGESVGKYKLGMTYHKLIKTIQLENIAYKKIVLPTCIKIVTKNMVFLLVNNVIMQITVYGDFKGTFNDTIGIGSSLNTSVTSKPVNMILCRLMNYEIYRVYALN